MEHSNHIFIDASKPIRPPETGFVQMGTATSPDGETIGMNSRYLLMNDKPWFPVMGEFHFVRYPEKYWEEEILKMKAGGIQIVATYVIWIYHEEIEGRFDWSGQRDFRKFVQLCQKHGLYVFARIGPWAHAETRNGGFPDWLLKKGPTRSNDPAYLAHVREYYAQIAEQLHGLLWKDGGPVIGIQLENEYTLRGPGRGNEHILQLKKMARDLGLDVPVYTVTGWDSAAIPPKEVVPVFGGYPDAPWDSSLTVLPPNEVYMFRFRNRVGGDMGAQGPPARAGTSQEALSHYPFLAAEYGGGLQVTYHRRPVVGPDDLAAMLPVQLGSGVNLYGYYMFHGGADLVGSMTTLQESKASGSATDVPVISYDFQAPLSEYGEERESFRSLKVFNYFLNDFGSVLAPTVTAEPSVVPRGPDDFSVPRVAARTNGDTGFIFVNNYVRGYRMPERSHFQVSLKLPDETLAVPRLPIDVPSGAYFIWPVNFDLDGARLKYATAQVVTKIDAADDRYYFFAATDNVPAEFSFDRNSLHSLTVLNGDVERVGATVNVRNITPGTNAAFSLQRRNGGRVHVIVLAGAEAKNLWRARWQGHDQAIITVSDVFFDQANIHLRSRGQPEFHLQSLPSLSTLTGSSLNRVVTGRTFAESSAHDPQQHVKLDYLKTREAHPVPPVKLASAVSWRKQAIAEAPDDGLFRADAAEWRIKLDLRGLTSVSDVYLQIRYAGDVARLYSGTELLDDNFYDGLPWNIGLKRFERQIAAGPLTLQVLPLRSDAPIFIPERLRPEIKPGSQVAEVESIVAVPEYEIDIKASHLR